MNLDQILEKIKNSGMESLTKEEKDFLKNYNDSGEKTIKNENNSFNELGNLEGLNDLGDFFRKLSKEFLLNSIKDGKLFDPKDVWNKLSDEAIKNFTGGDLPSYQAIDRNTDIKFSNFIKEISEIIKESAIKYIENTKIEDILDKGDNPNKFKELQHNIFEKVNYDKIEKISEKYNISIKEINNILFSWK